MSFSWRKQWISTKGHVPSVVCYGLHCSGSCPLLHLGCVHSQVASEASVTTTERHLTNSLAPAGGRGRSTQALTKCCYCGHVLYIYIYIRIFYIYYTKMFFLSSTNPMKRSKPKNAVHLSILRLLANIIETWVSSVFVGRIWWTSRWMWDWLKLKCVSFNGDCYRKIHCCLLHLLSKYIFKSAIFVLVLFDFIFGLRQRKWNGSNFICIALQNTIPKCLTGTKTMKWNRHLCNHVPEEHYRKQLNLAELQQDSYGRNSAQ